MTTSSEHYKHENTKYQDNVLYQEVVYQSISDSCYMEH